MQKSRTLLLVFSLITSTIFANKSVQDIEKGTIRTTVATNAERTEINSLYDDVKSKKNEVKNYGLFILLESKQRNAIIANFPH